MDKVKTGIVYTTIKTCRCIQSLFSDKPRVPDDFLITAGMNVERSSAFVNVL